MAMIMTMPDLTWTVRVGSWTWIYKFSRKGTVTWRDPWNGMHGSGHWRIAGSTMTTTWAPSATTEQWDVPLDTNGATGKCSMKGTTYDINAVAQDYYLKPGDVVYTGDTIIRGNGTAATIVYDDEVRTGGTVAWLCKNPGNIRDGDKYGAFPGKQLYVNKAGAYAIFPDELTGLMAVIAVLRVYGRVTISQALHKYAPKGDGNNAPGTYAAVVAKGLGLSVDTYLPTLSDEQMMRMATVMTGVETTTPGTAWARGDSGIPYDLAQRLAAPP